VEEVFRFYRRSRREVLKGIVLNTLFMVVELVSGILSNSLALVSDATHDFADSVSLAIMYFALGKAGEEPTLRKTFGYHRVTVLAALTNAVLLVLVTLFIFYRAYLRVVNPEPVDGAIVFLVALLGMVFNGVVAFGLLRGHEGDINMRSVFWHVAEDALGWGGVLLAGAIIMATGFYLIDPIISVLIGLIVLKAAWSILVDATNILMEAVPKGLDAEKLKEAIESFGGVRGVHDLHVWSIGSSYHALSCHALVRNMKLVELQKLGLRIKRKLAKNYGVTHATIEFECEDCSVIGGKLACK
jgi:cobalt-zinc-cadmium efflux system protein